jgi:hypothetical protein
MATRSHGTWRLVAGTIRSAVFPEPGSKFGQSAVSSVLGPAVLIWNLIDRIRGHRVTFMYTYLAEGKYRIGYTHGFVRKFHGTPRLFGKAAGETIYIRYNPSQPAVSVILSQDNPVPGKRGSPLKAA